MSLSNLAILTGLSKPQVVYVVTALTTKLKVRKGRPHHLTPARRVLLVLVWLRTNLTERGVAAIFGVSQSTAHRTITAVLPLVAALHPNVLSDGPEHLLLDGTLNPVHDQSITKKSKNYRRSINTQVICTHRRKIIYVGKAFPGNRNDIIVARSTVPVGPTYKTDGGYRTIPGAILPPPRTQPRARRRHIQVRARIEHVLARMKDWQILRQCRARGETINLALRAVAYPTNIRLGHVSTDL